MSRRSNGGEYMAASWKLAFGLIVAGIPAGAILGGCAETMPLINLPDITKLPQNVLSKDQQQKAMNQMIEKGQAQQAEAAKQAERSK
jgi:hypothetical protein